MYTAAEEILFSISLYNPIVLGSSIIVISLYQSERKKAHRYITHCPRPLFLEVLLLFVERVDVVVVL